MGDTEEYDEIGEMCEIVFPPDETGYLAVIRGYFDESYKDRRVYTIGGYVGRDRDWRPVAHNWRNRRLRDGIQCFHAADCEDGREEFEKLKKEERIALKIDLIHAVLAEKSLGGFGSAVIIEDFYKVRESSDRAKEVLGPSPYFLCFQTILGDICAELDEQGFSPALSLACIFEEQEEFSGRAKKLYDDFKRVNPSFRPRLGTLTYASKGKFVPLEIADNLAYETMKEILNHKFDPDRPRRKSFEAMKHQIRRVSWWTEPSLRKFVEIGRTGKELGVR